MIFHIVRGCHILYTFESADRFYAHSRVPVCRVSGRCVLWKIPLVLLDEVHVRFHPLSFFLSLSRLQLIVWEDEKRDEEDAGASSTFVEM